ncbi:hypothetical protein OF001_U120030 [Pseudomonas sp. OF001]|nr:hypothetical protein OF001_U120030 [Pseudomonas sp. OF001]
MAERQGGGGAGQGRSGHRPPRTAPCRAARRGGADPSRRQGQGPAGDPLRLAGRAAGRAGAYPLKVAVRSEWS